MKSVKEAYIGIGEHDGVRIKTLKNINPVNAYHIDYVRYVANAFNFVLGRFAYFSDRFNKPQREVIITDADMANTIGCHAKHSSLVLGQLKDLFNLEYERKRHRGGARVIKLNQRIVDFLRVFTDTDLTEYIIKYDIQDDRLVYALTQVFNYRTWSLPESKLSPIEKTNQDSFLKRQKDYFHRVASSNRSDRARILLVTKYKDKLSEKELSQLRIITERNGHGERLAHYWFMTLIKLEQKITGIIRVQKNDLAEVETASSDDNQAFVEDVARNAAAAAAMKIPELPARDYIEVLATWKNMIGNQKIPVVTELNHSIIQLIDEKTKKHGKEILIKNIGKISALEHRDPYPHKMTFERFMKDKTFDMLIAARVKEDIEVDWFADYLKELHGEDPQSNPHINIEEIPDFNSIQDAASWWKAQN